MTFSIIARCAETGAFGAAITTSNLAVGSRCVRLAHGQGAFLSQHRTDPRLGDIGIAHLVAGRDAQTAIAETRAATPDIEWRQLAALDARGGSAVYHGRLMYSIYAHAGAADCLAIGNILDNDKVPDRMAEAFERSHDRPFTDRLMIALEAGRDAGGEITGPLRSSGLRVTGEEGVDLCDLRIDSSHGDAVADLRALFDAYQPHGDLLRSVAFAPDNVPVSRALFEASLARIRDLGLVDRFPTERRARDWMLHDPPET